MKRTKKKEKQRFKYKSQATFCVSIIALASKAEKLSSEKELQHKSDVDAE